MRSGQLFRMCLAGALFVGVAFCSLVNVHAAAEDDAQAVADRAEGMARRGDYATAIAEWSQLQDCGRGTPDSYPLSVVKASALVGIAEAQRQLGQLNDSLATASLVLDNYSQLRSQCCEATLIIGKIRQAQGNATDAVRSFASLLRDYPEKLNRSLLARTRIEELLPDASLSAQDRSDMTAGIAAYDAAKQDEDTITAARRAAMAKVDAGDAAGARQDLLTLLAHPSVNGSHAKLKLLGEMQLRLGATTNARATFERMFVVMANECNPEECRRGRLEALYQLGDFAEVASEGNAAVSVYSEGSTACELAYYRARAYDRQSQVDECLQAYDDLISRYASSTDADIRTMVSIALARKGSRLAGLGRQAEAAASLQLVISEYPETNMAKSATNSLAKMQQGGGH